MACFTKVINGAFDAAVEKMFSDDELFRFLAEAKAPAAEAAAE